MVVRHGFPRLDVDGYFVGFDRAIGVLAGTRGGNRARAATLGDALAAVLALWLLRREDPSAQWTGQRLAAFHDHVREVLGEHGRDFAGYLAEFDLDLESETATGWYNACFTRSVVDILRKDAGLPQRALGASDWEEASDEEMRDVATRVPPLPADVIPQGMPEEHWWWFVASGPPEKTAYDH
ncbi:hypothetical protein [Micromonospora echinofusca]|uniref:Uncharacterized protein n=1 Tax=Micromonospora echinofusca TaxID=47858 RepID=A0ABS3VIU5_MICEH|nr:hypothetical protein [Micromonospora echinofusca]MBO4204459.1 hypothetical protein [Micromonospora echinofusca]